MLLGALPSRLGRATTEMALALVNGRPVIDGHICFPRVGAWHADLMIDVGQTEPGSISIVFQDGTTFNGTVIRQAVFAAFLRLRIVGGAGKLYNTQVAPKHWTMNQAGTAAIPLSVPLQYILNQAGEKLSPTADQGVLNTNLVSWTCVPQSCSAALRSLIQGYANSWRVLPDGTVWIGNEQWKAVDGTFNYVLLHKHTGLGVMELAEDSPLLRPGTTLGGNQITRVDNFINQGSFRTVAHYFETP